MSTSATSDDVYADTLAVFDRRDDPAEPLTTPEVSEALDAERRTVYKRLDRLAGRGELRTKKTGARSRVWWRSLAATGSPYEGGTDRGHVATASAGGSEGDDGRSRADASEDRHRDRAASERRYRTLVDNFPNGMVVLFDESRRITAAGGQVLSEMGRTADSLVGQTVEELFGSDPALADRHRRAVDDALGGNGRSFEMEYAERVWLAETRPVVDATGDPFAAMGIAIDITERVQRERYIRRQRQQLAALNDLNDVVHDITAATIERSTRDEIETIVCEHLAAIDSYRIAWIGDVDGATGTVTPRTAAGVEGPFDDVTVPTAHDDERNLGPTGRAVLRREMQTARDVGVESSSAAWRDRFSAYDFRSVAAIPIVHEGTLYGVLTVHADRPDAFVGKEREVIGRLGEVVGHAICAVERKRALMSDEVVELECRIRDVFGDVRTPSGDGVIALDRAIPIDDGYVVYGTVTGDAMAVVEAVVDADEVPGWERVNVLRSDGEKTRFGLRASDPPVFSTVAAHGGYVDEARIEDGDQFVRIHLAPGTDVRGVIDAIRADHADARMVTRHQIRRVDRSPHQVVETLAQRLTDRQRTALEAAYFSGFFDLPRDSSGEDVAKALEIGTSTFHQHIRKAEKKLLDVLFDET